MLGENERYSIKKVNEYLSKKEKLDEYTYGLMDKVRHLEKLYDKKKKELQLLRRTELNRIGKEYLVNDYERRYDAPQDVLIAAIVGEDNISAELTRQVREQKVSRIYLFL